MPCGDGIAYERELNERTMNTACEAMDLLEKSGLLDKASPEAQAWWRDHKRFDTARGRRK